MIPPGSPTSVAARDDDDDEGVLSQSSSFEVVGVDTKASLLEAAPSLPLTPPLVTNPRRPQNRRKKHVRGLWGEAPNDAFRELPDVLLSHIFAFANFQTKLLCEKVSLRFQALQDYGFIESTGDLLSASSSPSPLLKSEARHIAIHEIGHRQIPDLPISQLHTLELTGCESLTDTALHAILLSTSKQLPLRKLNLSDCPLLTDASLRSVVARCPKLRELSVAGCRGIRNVLSLSALWKRSSVSGLSSLFGPPPRLAASRNGGELVVLDVRGTSVSVGGLMLGFGGKRAQIKQLLLDEQSPNVFQLAKYIDMRCISVG